MGERKGQNKYYPPDFDPKKHKSLNGYHGTHALRERARKLDQGIMIIRFEMPYNIWCDGCKAHIAMGVRYNAEKKKVGMYFTTPIYEFRMKCHLCDQHFEIRTDPKNLDYVIMSGAKRKEQRWDMGENEQIVTEEKSEIKRLQDDPMFKLEHETIDQAKVSKLMPTLRELEVEQSSKWKDDYEMNSLMRGFLRSEKKVITDQKNQDKKLLDKWNIDLDLVKESDEDVKMASLFKYNTINSSDDLILSRSEKRKSIETESIFNKNQKKKSTATTEDQPKIKIDRKEIQIKSLSESLKQSKMKSKDLSSLCFNLNPKSTQPQPSPSLSLKQSIVIKKSPTKSTETTEKTDIDAKPTSANSLSLLMNNYDDDNDDEEDQN